MSAGPARGYDHTMAYDQELADRIRKLVADQQGVTEMKMFGGIAFLVGGNMAVAASGQGGVMVRVDPPHSPTRTATTEAYVAGGGGPAVAGALRQVDDRPGK